jgi:hypothetical protein
LLRNTVPTSAIDRRAERRQRQVELIKTLRRLAALAEQKAWDTGALSDRCRLAQLIERTDDLVHRLLNNQPSTTKKEN